MTNDILSSSDQKPSSAALPIPKPVCGTGKNSEKPTGNKSLLHVSIPFPASMGVSILCII